MGLITVVLFYFYMQGLEKPALDAIPHTSVVVAKTAIPERSLIMTEALEIKSLPTSAVHPDAFRSIEEVAGGITRTDILAGEQLLAPRVFTEDTRATLSYRIPEGMRAVSIPLGASNGVAGFISPGDSIDILISLDDEEVNETFTTYTYFQNIKVLATGSFTREFDTEEPAVVSTLTLLVTPEEAEALVYANYNTSLWMTLRSPLDDTIVELEFYNLEYFEAFRER